MLLKKLFWCTSVVIIVLNACNEKKDEGSSSHIAPIQMSFNEDLRKYPDSLSLRIKVIQAYTDSGDYKNALRITDEGIQRDSLIPDLWDIKASVSYQNGDTIGAIKSFEKAIGIIPLPDYLVSIGSLYAQTKNPKALMVADDILAGKNPKLDKDAYFIKGLYYSYTGDKIKSITFFDKIIGMDYTYMFAYREKGISLYDMGKYKEAAAVLQKAVTIENSFDEGYYWLGRCNEKLNDKQAAIDNYKTALLYDKDFVEARQALNNLQSK